MGWLRLALSCLALSLSLCLLPSRSNAQQIELAEAQLPNAPSQSLPCSITGTVVDRDGAFIPGATVTLTREGSSVPPQQTISGSDGRFTFPTVPAGPYTLTVTAAGFVPARNSGGLLPGQTLETPNIILPYAATSIDVQVTASEEEIAQAQIEAEEKQRVLGFLPNFYVVYAPHPAPLNARQKYELAWKSLIDPVSFLAAGFAAGIQQADDDFSGYGQGVSGYSKRYAASYGNVLTGTLLGGAILPILFKQDPRYFYKGDGTVRERTLYALKFSVYCKGDNGNWQINYSGILGSAASGAISNLYYPKANRDGWSLTAENAALGIAGTAVGNIFQEFVVRKLTPHAGKNQQAKTQPSTAP